MLKDDPERLQTPCGSRWSPLHESSRRGGDPAACRLGAPAGITLWRFMVSKRSRILSLFTNNEVQQDYGSHNGGRHVAEIFNMIITPSNVQSE